MMWQLASENPAQNKTTTVCSSNPKNGATSLTLLQSLSLIAQEVGVPLTAFVLEGISFLPGPRSETGLSSIDLLLSISCPKLGSKPPSPKPFIHGKRRRRMSKREILASCLKLAGKQETTLDRMSRMTQGTLSKCLTISQMSPKVKVNLSSSYKTSSRAPRSVRKDGLTDESLCNRGTTRLRESS